MTIRFRNRLTLSFFIIAVIVLGLAAFFTGYQILTGNFSFPEVYMKNVKGSGIFGYNPYCVLLSIFTLMLYVCITTYIIFKSFNKTQATDIVFFLLFLAACLCDSMRILVILFHITSTFSKSLIIIGNISILARLLAPLGLFGTIILSTEDYRQNTERNALIIIIAALFFAEIIPLNTASILPNFGISYSYYKPIHYFSLLLCIISISTLFFMNLKNEYSQKMTVGFALICIAYSALFSSYSIFITVFGIISISIGTPLYIGELHKHYLWLD